MATSPDLILAIDQGTSSSRAIAFDRSFRAVASASRRVEVAYPRPGWVEQDADQILDSVVDSVRDVLEAVGGSERIAATGIANQGETIVAWDSRTGSALAPAIVWQCRRSESIVDRLRTSGIEPEVRARTGLPLDAYYSAGKASWLLEHVPLVRQAAGRGALRFGTIDAWLTMRLGDLGALTDPSTASRTQLVSLDAGDWDDELLSWFGLEREMLPTIVPTAGEAGSLRHVRWGGSLPLFALACDQQAALAGHGAFVPGAIKATYGTGAFVLANAGHRTDVVDGLETSIAWELPGLGRTTVVQGGVFSAGALIDWLRDGLGIPDRASDPEAAARQVSDTGGARVLPALVGLGSPFYDGSARGVIAGLTSATRPEHIVRAALDGIAQRTTDVVEAVLAATGGQPETIRVDGGLAANGYLMERQADLLGMTVEVASIEESTALGTAGLAAIGAGIATADDLVAANPAARRFEPRTSPDAREEERSAWRQFVAAARRL